jgi:predicted transcriptional regulator
MKIEARRGHSSNTEICNQRRNKNENMYKAMLSNDQCRNYIDSLLNFGLIMGQNNGSKMVYKVTNKGATFLDYYDQMMHLLPMSLDEKSDQGYYKILSYKT